MHKINQRVKDSLCFVPTILQSWSLPNWDIPLEYWEFAFRHDVPNQRWTRTTQLQFHQLLIWGRCFPNRALNKTE